MTSINYLNSVTVVPTSLVNGASTTYTLTVNVYTPLISSDKFTITFPSQITLPTSPSCTIGTALTAITCAVSG
jgi:hypothetical protein